MKTMVKCTACGHANHADRLYCTSCGAKLDLTRVRIGHDGGSLVWHFTKRVLRFGVLLALLAVLGLLLWPTTPQGAVGTEEDGYRCFEKLGSLYEAIGAGISRQREVTEAEANAYFEMLLDNSEEPTADRSGALKLRWINLSFTEEGVVVHIAAEWQFVRLHYELAGYPHVGEDGFRVDIERVAMGRLVMPEVVEERFAARLLPLFAQLQRERRVLDGLTEIELGDARVRMSVSPNNE